MNDNKPLVRVLIGTTMFILGILNLLMLSNVSISPSEMTLQQGLYVATGGTDMVLGALLCAYELME